jgi:hypothetical protein
VPTRTHKPRVAGSIPAAATFSPSGRQIWGSVGVRESATTGASIHRGIHRASNGLRVPCFSATDRGRDHRRSCLPVASMSMAAGTTAATSTGLSERFEARLKGDRHPGHRHDREHDQVGGQAVLLGSATVMCCRESTPSRSSDLLERWVDSRTNRACDGGLDGRPRVTCVRGERQ